MIPIKTPAEIEIMNQGGKKLWQILQTLLSEIKPGKTGMEIEKLASELIEKSGGKASFKMVPNYHWATCICINDCVVHGIPTDIPFKEGDVVGIDIGLYYQGFHTDVSWTVQVKDQKLDQNSKIETFLQTGEEALKRAIEQVKPGNRIGHISQAIQSVIEDNGYSVVHELIGHGVGKKLHEEPEIPGFEAKKLKRTPEIKEGMVLAIEVIYNVGDRDVYIDDDGWTIRTKDGKISALFEKTVAVRRGGFFVLT